ncbi:4078_t:CDS:2 [Diversispora eburnea]|uniref:Golgi apparatus membrane protein TVP38 n=1 Tax=Diversispora eburnea TaxID=1213867 RepID=A0A9N9A8Q7_9GLOM|nr:4078_t:CDS:2 [Diversispora eburnea]
MIIFSLIFFTTFPLVIGYSTLITLSGFTFGFIKGFIISYFAALTGAITVFLLSRRWFKKSVRKLLNKSNSMSAIVKALLFFIRLAPYPYNVLNTLLSATHISLSTFAGATALSLFKLIIHVWIDDNIENDNIEDDNINNNQDKGIFNNKNINQDYYQDYHPGEDDENDPATLIKTILMMCGIIIGNNRKIDNNINNNHIGINIDIYNINNNNDNNIVFNGIRYRRNSTYDENEPLIDNNNNNNSNCKEEINIENFKVQKQFINNYNNINSINEEKEEEEEGFH